VTVNKLTNDTAAWHDLHLTGLGGEEKKTNAKTILARDATLISIASIPSLITN